MSGRLWSWGADQYLRAIDLGLCGRDVWKQSSKRCTWEEMRSGVGIYYMWTNGSNLGWQILQGYELLPHLFMILVHVILWSLCGQNAHSSQPACSQTPGILALQDQARHIVQENLSFMALMKLPVHFLSFFIHAAVSCNANSKNDSVPHSPFLWSTHTCSDLSYWEQLASGAMNTWTHSSVNSLLV